MEINEELAQLFSAQTVCLFAVIEWISSAKKHDRSLLIERLYKMQAEAYGEGKPVAAGAMSHIIELLERHNNVKI